MSMTTLFSDLTSNASFAPVAIVALRATMILALTALALLLVRRQSASRRHVIIVLGTAGSLGASVVAAAGMQWRVGILPTVASAPARTAIVPVAAVVPARVAPMPVAVPFDAARIPDAPVVVATPIMVDGPALAAAAPLETTSPWTLPSIPVTLGLLWIVGFTWLLGHFMVGVVRRTRLAWRASALLPAPWERACHRLEARGRLPARVRILATEDTRMPMTWGVIRPTVLVPAWSDWSDDERDAALLHELAHVQRGDAFALTLMTVARAVHWFNPIAWWLTSAERLAREEACDDLVLEAGVRPSLYAEQLLGIVCLPGEERPPAAALAMARSSSLARRLCSILQPTQRRDLPGTGTRLALGVAAFALSACVGTITPVARVAPESDTPAPAVTMVVAADPAMPADPVVTAAPEVPEVPAVEPTPPATAAPVVAAVNELDVPTVAAPALAAVVTDVAPTPMVAVFPPRSASAPLQDRCQGRRGGNVTHLSSSGDDGRRKVTWKENGCELELQTRGEYKLSPNLDDVRSIESGGYVQLREDDGKVEREVRITPGSNGALQYDYRVGGDRRPWDAEGRAWFAAVALRLDRRTAWAVDVRLPALLQAGGVDGVIAEIDRMDGDYARRIYFTRLATRERLTSAQLVRVIESAGAKIESDYEMTEMLVAVGKQPAFDDPAQRSLAKVAGRISSSYERRRALSGLLQKDGLAPATVGYMLEATKGMDSDYEVAELLIAISARYAMLPGTQQYYLDALATIDSDYEYRRVFTAMTRSGPLTPASVAVILDHAGAHMGGYELAELLVAIDKVVASDRSLGTPFLRALRRVDSGYEKGRVMKHLVRQAPDTAVVLQMLADSRTIDSNYERLQFLLEVSKAYRLEGKLREAYLDAAESIDGDYERGQALAAASSRRNGAR